MTSDQQYLYFAKRPPLEEMETVTLSHRTVNGTASLLQMKCRELARADGNCVVAPIPGTNDTTAWAIAKIGYFSECGIQQKLSPLGFEIISKNPVTAETLRRCYQFSIVARMAPKWNRIGEHLVQGCEFFCSGKTYYVGVNVNITSSEIIVALEAGQIKFTFFKPEDLNITPSLLQQYNSGQIGIITETSMQNRQCILLPNYTRGSVYSVSATVPVSRQFSTYNSIRIHWKRHHGFVLPDQQSIFYQIYFTFKPSQLLSYPGCCVLQYPPITYKCKDTAAICTTFLDCLHSRLPTLCGYPINYATQSLQPTVGLSTALHCQKYVNLLHVSKKPAIVGTACKVTDTSTTVNNYDSPMKPDHPYKPIFRPSLVSRKTCDERRPAPIQHFSDKHSHKLVSTPCTASNSQGVEAASSGSQIGSVIVTPAAITVPNKVMADSCLHKGNSRDNNKILHDSTNKGCSLIAEISRQKVATLKKWLVLHNVKFKAKSNKKDDLVKLVATHIKDIRELLVMSSEE